MIINDMQNDNWLEVRFKKNSFYNLFALISQMLKKYNIVTHSAVRWFREPHPTTA